MFVPTGYPDCPERVFWWDQLEQAITNTERTQLDTAPGSLSLETPAERRAAYFRILGYLKSLPSSQVLSRTEEICAELDVAPPRSGVLGWEELRQLSREGVTLGAHSRNHPLMSSITREEAHREVLGAQEDLEREIGTTLPIFAYPDGRFNEAVVEVLREMDYQLAFTTRRGTNDLRKTDPLRLRRINISRDATLPILRARLIHSSVYLNRWRPLFDAQPVPAASEAVGPSRPALLSTGRSLWKRRQRRFPTQAIFAVAGTGGIGCRFFEGATL